jgi:hypothetical protein
MTSPKRQFAKFRPNTGVEFNKNGAPRYFQYEVTDVPTVTHERPDRNYPNPDKRERNPK